MDAIASFVNKFHQQIGQPIPDGMEEVIGEIYLASLRTEEGRSLAFSVEIHADGPYERGTNRPMGNHFEKPRPINASEFVRLAPVVPDGSRRCLLVYRGPQGFILSGLCFDLYQQFGTKRKYPYDCNRRGAGTEPAGRYVARVLSPGRVILQWGDAVSELNGFNEKRRTSLAKYPPFVDWIRTATEINDGHLECMVSDWFSILQSIRANGHGGALIWVPEGCEATSRVKSKYNMQTRIEESWDLVRSRKDLCSTSRDDSSHHGKVWRVEHQTQRLAELANVDGAVLLEGQFRIAGFGCELQYDRTTIGGVGRLHEIDGAISEFDIETVGMRNRSAICFCANVPSAWAFVVSQDGDLRIMKTEEKTNSVVLVDFFEPTWHNV